MKLAACSPYRIVLVGVVAIALVATFPLANRAFSESGPTQSVSTRSLQRGITGSVRFEHRGKPLRAKTQWDADAPFTLRLRKLQDASGSYEARFVGTIEGNYDLRDYLEHEDGSPATELNGLPIQVVSTLPKDQRSDLFDQSEFQPKLIGGYRMMLTLLALAWLSVPIVVFVARKLRQKAPPQPVLEASRPTWVEQLRPLVEAAATRGLSVAEKGRLELLLVHYWRERSAAGSPNMAAAMQELRHHAEAGPLIEAIEDWLHRNADSPDDRFPESLRSLLQPIHTGAEVAVSHVRMPNEHSDCSQGSPR